MIRLHLKTAIRSLLRRKLYSAINIFGLAIGLTAFILIAMYVRHELSYDRYNKDYSNIYRVVRNEYTCSPPAMASHLKENITGITNSSHFIIGRNLLVSTGDNYFSEDEYYWTDNEFLEIFTIDLIQGDKNNVLKSNDDALISESIARKYFGNEDPMGKTITVSRKYDYRVAGVFKDIPGNSHYKLNVVLPVEHYFQISGNDSKGWASNFTYTYIKVQDGVTKEYLNRRMTDIEKELIGWTESSGTPYEQYFFFQEIAKIHLHSHRQQEVQVNGNIKNVYIFSSIALLILIIASINYINIATAIAGERIKEVGIRKIMGMKKRQLIHQFLTESVLIAIISIIIALVLTYLFMPLFGNLMQRELSILSSDIPIMVLLLSVLLFFIGFGTGIIPSRTLSGVSAISVLKGPVRGKGTGFRVRDILVGSQFVVAIVLIILTLNVSRQLKYISNIDPGYDKEQIINLRVFDKSMHSSMHIMKEEIERLNNVSTVSTSINLPNDIPNFTRPEWFCKDKVDCTPISYNPVDYDFVELFNIEIVEGRNFLLDYPSDAEGAFLVNEKAVSLAGWDSPLGMEVTHYDGSRGTIVGVMKDFNFRSMHSEIAPLYLILDPDASSFISIKLNSNEFKETIGSIEDIVNKYSPGAPFQYTFFDEEFERAYESDRRLGSIFAFFALLAVLLGCLGLYGMSSFTVNRRTKEIGVRKVFGAQAIETLILLLRSFLLPILLANVIAWPLAFYATTRWMEGFAYRSGISLWTFIIAALLVVIITLITVSVRSIAITKQTPALSLRHQ